MRERGDTEMGESGRKGETAKARLIRECGKSKSDKPQKNRGGIEKS